MLQKTHIFWRCPQKTGFVVRVGGGGSERYGHVRNFNYRFFYNAFPYLESINYSLFVDLKGLILTQKHHCLHFTLSAYR